MGRGDWIAVVVNVESTGKKMLQVARWLIDGCESLKGFKCSIRGVGTQDDPFIVPDDSDESGNDE